MPDIRVKVKVVFTIDIGTNLNPTIFEAQDRAAEITKEVFRESFSRAHLLKVETVELDV